jgi:cobalt-zinc-cadmium efflux system membrane fusion protein
VKLLGTVAELRKRLGDTVQQGEVVAVIESREVADAKSEFMAARLMHDLQQTLAARAKKLAESKSMAENEYLRVRNAFEDARVKRDTARQKLLALGLNEQQIEELLQRPGASLERQELRAPISGKVAERRVDLGALVGREGLESELYVIVDLSECGPSWPLHRQIFLPFARVSKSRSPRQSSASVRKQKLCSSVRCWIRTRAPQG